MGEVGDGTAGSEAVEVGVRVAVNVGVGAAVGAAVGVGNGVTWVGEGEGDGCTVTIEGACGVSCVG